MLLCLKSIIRIFEQAEIIKSLSGLGAKHLSWLGHLLQAAQATLENIALGSGAESSQPMSWHLGCTKSDLEKMAVHVSEHLRMLHLLITGHKSRHRALQPILFMYMLLILPANGSNMVQWLLGCGIRQSQETSMDIKSNKKKPLCSLPGIVYLVIVTFLLLKTNQFLVNLSAVRHLIWPN